jgi:hypothetical protein
MLNAPATGEAMAGLILDGASRQVDLAPFAPARLRALDPARAALSTGSDQATVSSPRRWSFNRRT